MEEKKKQKVVRKAFAQSYNWEPERQTVLKECRRIENGKVRGSPRIYFFRIYGM